MGKIGNLSLLPAAILLALTANASGQSVSELVGLDDLIDRLGAQAPTGAGVVVGQVEASSGGAFYPDQSHPEFAGKTFFEMSGASDPSSHATTVGKNQYGLSTSIAPDVGTIYLYEASSWVLSGFLRTNPSSSVLPVAPPGGLKSFNNSWVGNLGSTSYDNDCLRRADYCCAQYQLIITSGVNNGGPSQPLFSHCYNGIACGLRDGTHTSTNTLAPWDGPGRMKPEIVAPSGFTSFSTPIVNAANSLMVETARTWPGLASNPAADRSDVLKAVLLAGATHEDIHDGQWSNEPQTTGPDRGVTITPIDDVVGAGTVNVNRSHLILTGLEQDGQTMIPSSVNAENAGWDSAEVALGESIYYRVEVAQPADEVSILITWHRDVIVQYHVWGVADFDLLLWRIDEMGDPVTLVGDAGLPYFEDGNVVSESAVDNVEHLYVTNLAAGEYIIEVARVDSLPTYPTWEVAVAWLLPEPSGPVEDINGDGSVDVLDLLLVIAAWGECPGCAEDVNGDGMVDVLDLLAVIAAWT